ncbi:MAG TPA: hypothetical protein VFA53_12440 [Xanthobacteraceae bacterium]|nr:hypothetical protein [Xanthobacteraceae bacterium]
MTEPLNKFEALEGFLAGNFADADLAGQSDDQAAVADLNSVTLPWHCEVLRQARIALREPRLDWRHIAGCANRPFSDEGEARAWLSRIAAALERGIARFD